MGGKLKIHVASHLTLVINSKSFFFCCFKGFSYTLTISGYYNVPALCFTILDIVMNHTHSRRPTGLAPWHDAIIISRDVLTATFTRGQINQVRQVTHYRGADKSLAWPGRKQAYDSVRMVWISFGTLPCGETTTTTLMIAHVSMLLKSRVPDMLLSLFPSWLG